MFKYFSIILFVVLTSNSSDARETTSGAQASTPVSPSVFKGDLRDLPKAPAWRMGDPVYEINPRQRNRPRTQSLRLNVEAQEKTDAGEETVIPQKNQQPTGKNLGTPLLNFPGIGFTGVSPPDAVGDVGPNHYVQMVNSAFGAALTIFDKSANTLVEPVLLSSMWTSGGPCQTSPFGDPIVLYDQLADRWLLTEFHSFGVCIYVSRGPDPVIDGWYLYSFDTPDFPDYPKYAVWPDAYYMTSNEFDPAVYAFDRVRMLNGQQASSQRFTGPRLAGFPFQAFTPADLDGDTPPPDGSPGYFIRHRDDEVHGTGEIVPMLIDGSGSWQSIELNIGSALGASQVVIRFSFDSLDSIANSFEGWHLDDISVTADSSDAFTDDFESGAAGWTSTGLWRTTTKCSATLAGHSTPTSFYFGKNSNCSYSGNSTQTGTLDSPIIDLSAFSETATLSFNYFLQTEQFCPFDDARVQVSTDGGATFRDVSGNCADQIIVPGPPDQDSLELWEFNVDFADASQSTFSGPIVIPVMEFDSDLCGLFAFDCFPQPDTFQTLDPLREVVMWRLQYRNFGTHESLLSNFVTDVDDTDHGGIRWFELRKTPADDAWTLFQEGTYAPDNHHRWLGSIAMNGVGEIVLGYSVSSSTIYPSIRYTGRRATDPPGQMTLGEYTLIDGGASQTFSSRWGDYSAMSVDPADDCTFWFTHEYVSTLGIWQTRVGVLRPESCGGIVEIFNSNFE